MKIFFLILSLFLSLALRAQTILVSDYGAIPNSFNNATPAVQRAIAACRTTGAKVLSFPQGRYDFWPDSAQGISYYISNTSSEIEVPQKHQKVGIFLKGLSALELNGNGSVFVFHGKMISWVVDSCKGITLRNIAVNYERPGMSEMTIEKATADSVVTEVHRDSRYAVINGKLHWYGEGWQTQNFHAVLVRPSADMLLYSDWRAFAKSNVTQLTAGKLKFKGDFRDFKGLPGDVLTVRDRYRDYVAAFIYHSKDVNLQNIHMYSMHGLGIVSQFSENLNYDSVFVEPEKGSGRVIASSADGMHFSGCRGQITISNSRFSGLHDDPVNVHGTHLLVSEILSPTKFKIRFMHHQSYGFPAFNAGDTVACLHAASLKIFDQGLVSSASRLSAREMLIEFTKPLATQLKIGDALENITWTPALTIRNCHFERTISRGTLVTTRRKVLIENNTYYRTGMHAILIENDASGWFESGPVTDVTIRNNRFIECAFNSAPDNYIISINPQDHQPAPDYWVHHNINIENNEFKIYDYPLLFARSTKGLRFTGNKIVKSEFLPSGPRRSAIKLLRCSNVFVKDNSFYTGFIPAISLDEMKYSDIKTDIKPVLTSRQ